MNPIDEGIAAVRAAHAQLQREAQELSQQQVALLSPLYPLDATTRLAGMSLLQQMIAIRMQHIGMLAEQLRQIDAARYDRRVSPMAHTFTYYMHCRYIAVIRPCAQQPPPPGDIRALQCAR